MLYLLIQSGHDPPWDSVENYKNTSKKILHKINHCFGSKIHLRARDAPKVLCHIYLVQLKNISFTLLN